MKAVTLDRFGGREELHLRDVPAPTPREGEVLIRIAFAGVNPVDYKIREGYLAKLLPHHFPLIPGWDAAGTVEAVGGRVSRFRVGDRVFAYCRKPEVQWGTYAELVAVNEAHVARMPAGLGLSEAAGVPLTALTAWQALFDFAGLKKGDSRASVLVHAGAGGVGGFGIQFAKYAGATVLTTARAEKHGYVRELGADRPLDYTTEDFRTAVRAGCPDGVDIVFDCVGGETLDRSYELVRPGGWLVSIVSTPDEARAKALGIRSTYVFVSPNGEELTEIAGLFEKGSLKVPKVEVLPLSEVKRAHELSESRRVTGKIVLEIGG